MLYFSPMNYKQKQDLAQLMYVRGVVDSQAELAQRIGVSEQTISKWKKQGDWDEFKKSLLVSRQEQLRHLYNQLEELNNAIMGRDEGQRYSVKGEADTISKLTAAIRNLETDVNVAQIVDVFMKFNDFARKIDLEKAKELIGMQDAFIKTLL